MTLKEFIKLYDKRRFNCPYEGKREVLENDLGFFMMFLLIQKQEVPGTS